MFTVNKTWIMLIRLSKTRLLSICRHMIAYDDDIFYKFIDNVMILQSWMYQCQNGPEAVWLNVVFIIIKIHVFGYFQSTEIRKFVFAWSDVTLNERFELKLIQQQDLIQFRVRQLRRNSFQLHNSFSIRLLPRMHFHTEWYNVIISYDS